jgi:hypothetical protein
MPRVGLEPMTPVSEQPKAVLDLAVTLIGNNSSVVHDIENRMKLEFIYVLCCLHPGVCHQRDINVAFNTTLYK